MQSAQAWVEQLGHGELTLLVETLRNASGMALRDDAPLLLAAGRVLARHGLDPKPRRKPTNTEAGVFARAGCEAIVFGPGVSTGNAHCANEVQRDVAVPTAIDFYEALARKLCVKA